MTCYIIIVIQYTNKYYDYAAVLMEKNRWIQHEHISRTHLRTGQLNICKW